MSLICTRDFSSSTSNQTNPTAAISNASARKMKNASELKIIVLVPDSVGQSGFYIDVDSVSVINPDQLGNQIAVCLFSKGLTREK